MTHLSTTQTAKLRGVSRQRILVLAAQGRIPGAVLSGSRWKIPADWTPTAPPVRKGRKPDKL